MEWIEPTPYVDGEFVRAAELDATLRNNLGISEMTLKARLAADQDVTTTTLTASTSCFVDLAANEMWYMDIVLSHYQAAAGTINFKVAFNGTGGDWDILLQSHSKNPAGSLRILYNQVLNGTQTNATSWLSISSGTDHMIQKFRGLVATRTAGRFQPYFAQDTANASAIRLNATLGCIRGVYLGPNTRTVL